MNSLFFSFLRLKSVDKYPLPDDIGKKTYLLRMKTGKIILCEFPKLLRLCDIDSWCEFKAFILFGKKHDKLPPLFSYNE